MVRTLPSTLLALVAMLALETTSTYAVAIAPNQFENPPTIGSRDRELISAGHHTDSPFGSGCVGTNNLCALALSRAEDTERETLHREAPPLLWKVREDEDFQSQLQLSGPSLRLKQFYQRLGGDDYDFKRQLSEPELLRLLERFEEQGEKERQDKMHALPEVRRQMQQSRLWRNRFRKVTPDRDVVEGRSKRLSASGPSKEERKLKSAAWSAAFRADKGGVVAHTASDAGTRATSTLRKRHLKEEGLESVAEDSTSKMSEDEAFHAGLRERFARPRSPRRGLE